jgi:L-rhamnose isomerase
MLCLDMGHFHPTEFVADKISALFQFVDELLFHISRPVRWDSDHVVIISDEVRSLFEELVRSGKLSASHLGLDFFDGTMNRVGALVIGARAALKSLLFALLEPQGILKRYEEEGDFFARMALLEELKSMPFGAVWDHYCLSGDVPVDREVIEAVHRHAKQVARRE